MRFQVVDAHVEEFLAKTAINMRLEQYFTSFANIIRIGVVYDIFEMQKNEILRIFFIFIIKYLKLHYSI